MGSLQCRLCRCDTGMSESRLCLRTFDLRGDGSALRQPSLGRSDVCLGGLSRVLRGDESCPCLGHVSVGGFALSVVAGVLMASMVFASYAPRALALVAQRSARDYGLQFTELTRRLTDNARETVAARFDGDRLARTLAGLFRDAL